MFEWDENKRLKNIVARRLDFLDATMIFDGRRYVSFPSKHLGEERLLSTAILNDGKSYTVVWTWRGRLQRIISFRRARDGEERAYREVHG